VLGAGFVSEVGTNEKVCGGPATGVALLLAFDWELTVAVNLAVKPAPPAGERPEPGTMNLGSPVESGSGATLNVEMVGYALACGVGVIGTGVLWLAPVTLSVAPVTWIDAPDAAQEGMLR
jgi:hypothetical protein